MPKTSFTISRKFIVIIAILGIISLGLLVADGLNQIEISTLVLPILFIILAANVIGTFTLGMDDSNWE